MIDISLLLVLSLNLASFTFYNFFTRDLWLTNNYLV
jgi:hypothetical protein